MSNIIRIDGDISPYSYGARYLNYMLSKIPMGESVTIVITSYGGDINEAILMGDTIAKRGNVTVEYLGFNASASTIIGLYASKSVISADAFYLIHKPLNWIDAFGMFNEDDIDNLLAYLKNAKDGLSEITLWLAKKYSERTTAKVGDMLALMKQEKWLSAEDAVKRGFCDEVIESSIKSKNRGAVKNNIANIFLANGLPKPPTIDNNDNDGNILMTAINDFKDIIAEIKRTFSQNKDTMKSKIPSLLNIMGLSDLTPDASKKVNLSEELLLSVENRLVTLTKSESDLKEQVKNITASLNSLYSALSEIDASINSADNANKIDALKKYISGKPLAAVIPKGTDNHDTSVDFVLDAVNNLI